jgi:aryl-alcohol dehydrogenase-like predicted oxidoreductase
MQCQYNLLYREEEREMMPYCHDEGIAVTTFSPLARGFLTGAERTARTAHDIYLNFYGDAIDVEIARRVREVSQRRGVTPAHIANAWVTGSPRVTSPLIGADAPEQVDVAVAAAELKLDHEERKFLEEPYRPRDEINDYNPVRRPRAYGAP